MRVFKDIAILDITTREYGGGRIPPSKTRIYMDMDDLPWDPDTEEFWDDDDNGWGWWKDKVMAHICCLDIVKVEFKVLQSWNDKLYTFFVKEF